MFVITLWPRLSTDLGGREGERKIQRKKHKVLKCNPQLRTSVGENESSKEAVSPAARYPDSGVMENGLYAGAAGCNAARSAARTGAGGSFLKRESGTIVCRRVGERGGLEQCSVLTCAAGARLD